MTDSLAPLLELAAALPAVDPLTALLPPEVTSTIVQKAGLHMRQVSRAYRSLHPPLRSLAPHGSLTASAELPKAIVALPSTLTSLDLRGIALPPSGVLTAHCFPITPAVIAAIAKALPHLQELALPMMSADVAPSILPILQACPNLHTLVCPYFPTPMNHAPTPTPTPAPPSWAPLLEHPVAARVRSLSLPPSAAAAISSAPPGALPHLTHLSLPSNAPLQPSALATIAAAAPAVRSLRVLSTWRRNHAHELSQRLCAFAALTELAYHNDRCDEHTPTGELLAEVGALTGLRSLKLNTHHRGWHHSEAGWLARLAGLSHLDLTFRFESDQVGPDGAHEAPDAQQVARSTAEVASAAAARLPALLHLRVAFRLLTGACPEAMLAPAHGTTFFRALAAATQLRSLCLASLHLPPAEAALLAGLPHLTSLRLIDCLVPHDHARQALPGPLTLQWVASMPLLREFAWHSVRQQPDPLDDFEHPPWHLLAGLSNLQVLEVQLAVARDAILAAPMLQLLAALAPQLQSLHLEGWAPGLGAAEVPAGAIQRMASLTDLHLSFGAVDEFQGLVRLVQLLGLPDSLRRCYVPWNMHGTPELEQLSAAHPSVAFRAHARLEPLEGLGRQGP